MLDFSKILWAAKKLREQNLNLNEQIGETKDAQNLGETQQTMESAWSQPKNSDWINSENMPTTQLESTLQNNEQKIKTSWTSIPITSYISNINNWLNKLLKSNKAFSPTQKRKIAQLYTNARNKYITSSQSQEETEAFNSLKSNPIWKRFWNN